MLKKRYITSFTLAAAAVLFNCLTPAYAIEERTARRAVTFKDSDMPPYLMHMKKRKKHSWSYAPTLDPIWHKYRHPEQWKGLGWDTSAWPEGMTDEDVLNAMYGANIFRRQYVNRKNKAIVEVGSTFYKLSDLDKRRSLKLLADYFDFFGSGHAAFEVKDWKTRQRIGEYNKKGFQPF